MTGLAVERFLRCVHHITYGARFWRHDGNMREKVRPAPRQQSRKGWQRAAAVEPPPPEVRETFRVDAPSPSEEILAKHEAELGNQEATDTDGEETQVFCF